MKHIFWLVENELCGRPGPTLKPWNLKKISNAGVGAILSLNFAQSVNQQKLKDYGINHHCVPLAANAPPKPGELALCLERLPLAYQYAREQIAAGKVVMAHCHHGKDRTGLFMAYYLMMRRHISAEEAIKQVKTARSVALSADGWDSFAKEVLSQVNPQLPRPAA